MSKVILEKNRIKPAYPLMTPRERLSLLKSIKGIWKNRKPDPMKELKKMRQEDRKLSSLD